MTIVFPDIYGELVLWQNFIAVFRIIRLKEPQLEWKDQGKR